MAKKGEVYNPLIGCEKCAKNTRHVFHGTEEREYQCVEDRKCLTPEERKLREENAKFKMLLYRCVECSTVRGYGNEELVEWKAR